MLRGWICNIFFGEVESSGVYEMYEYPPVIKAVGGGAVHDLKSIRRVGMVVSLGLANKLKEELQQPSSEAKPRRATR